MPLPGGGEVQVTERDAGGAGGEAGDRQNVLLRYNAPALGSVDLRFQMDAGALSLSVTLPAGQPLELAQAGAESLRQALLPGGARARRGGHRRPAARAPGPLCLTLSRHAGAPPRCTTRTGMSPPR